MEYCDVCLIRANQEGHDGHQEEDRGPELRLVFQSLTVKPEPPLDEGT